MVELEEGRLVALSDRVSYGENLNLQEGDALVWVGEECRTCVHMCVCVCFCVYGRT